MNRKLAVMALYLLILALGLGFVALLAAPVLYWASQPTHPLNVMIVDKTVPVPDYREHKGLMWILNYLKITNLKTGEPFQYQQDYYGFYPVSQNRYDIRGIPATKGEYPHLIYLTDTYGVYTDDYLTANVEGTRSNLIYGGLNSEEIAAIKDKIGQGNILIGEFNIASSPTNGENRKELEKIFGVSWKGWKGRYFKDLTRDVEVAVWMVENYEKQYGQKWQFSGEGLVLISDNDQIVVLDGRKDVGPKALTISYDPKSMAEFDVTEREIPYQYWFEFVEPWPGRETLATYTLDLTESGKNTLAQLGLPSTFPAAIRNQSPEFTSYYLVGDFADLQNVYGFWNFYGLDRIKRLTSKLNRRSADYFYWNGYLPMIKKILTDARNRSEVPLFAEENGNRYRAKTVGKGFYVYNKGEWKKTFLKGVNIGAGKPGTFPGELAITGEDYFRWFQWISAMNADVIRVYTTLKPEFYEALLLYNKTAPKPLYLMQGVWVKEEDIAELEDAYADEGRIINGFIKDARDLTDILHGNAQLPERGGFASGKYTADVSPYVIGWVMGIEWDPLFVEGTNVKHPDKKEYQGEYLYTAGASPFEAFLCEVGDRVIAYEQEKYKTLRPVSFNNWPTTDMLKHPNEPNPKEDMAMVNMEHIKAKEHFTPGLFASYHIYPYYPDFMNYQKEYASFRDEKTGQIDSYKAYLRDLMKEHTMPVLVAEFGIPASRGKAHDNIHMGYNQGQHDETEQGLILEHLLQDIYDEGYCGGLVFAWQDEWFKRTWNTMDLDLPDFRPFWSNTQTNEQVFGLLAFDPGEKRSVCYVDGETEEWQNEKPVYANEHLKLYAKADEKYLYVLADVSQFDFAQDTLAIPIDTIASQGNSRDLGRNLKFSRPADFLVLINGRENSRILVDANYDPFNYMYAEILNMVVANPLYRNQDSGIFNPIYLALNRTLTLPEDKITIPFSKYETGKLQYGIANPEKEGYNSLADFYHKNGKIEIKIPWQLLNVMDPSSKSIMGDLYTNKKFSAEKVEAFSLGAGVIGRGVNETIGMNSFSWNPWINPTYHERLKPSYYKMKEAFAQIESK